MKNKTHLFHDLDLGAQLHHRQERVRRIVDEIPKDQFLVSSDDDLVDYVTSHLRVDPIILYEESITMDQQETKIDVSSDPNRWFRDRSRPFLVPGTRVDIDIPYSGESWLFQFRPSTYTTVLPQGEVTKNNLRLSISKPHDADPSVFKSDYSEELKLLKKYVQWSYAQVEEHNNALFQLAQQAIADRRERLTRHGNLAALLDIPIAAKPDAPSLAPVKVEVRKPKPLPTAPKEGITPEPGISDEIYEHILHFIRHQGRTFEKTPATYAIHGEEDLRNIILAQLNGHFEGDASGETFRARGKTDICIEQDNRAAFIGECKIWTGPSGLIAALDQLLAYLTWRDSKSALIFFNTRNKDFSKIIESIPESAATHLLFLRNVEYAEAGEWRIQMRSKEDEGRRVKVHIFVFDLFQS